MESSGGKQKKPMAWGWVLFWLILFWPLGLFFLFKRLDSDKTASLKNAKNIATISYVIIGLGIIYLSASPVAAVACIGGGIWVNIISRRMKADGEKYKKYISIVVNQSQADIDNIAAAVGVPYDEAVKDLQKMIDLGLFSGAHINETNRQIVLAQTTPPPDASTAETEVQTQIQTKVVTCQSCGANNTLLVGKICECEFCGSPLQ